MASLEQEIAAHRHTLDLLRQTENAYGRFVPHQLLRLLNAQSILDLALGEQTEKTMTILFSDIRDFTCLSESMTPQQTFSFINSYLGEMEPVISRHGGIVDKYIGDAIMALFPSGADQGLQSAIDMLAQLEFYNVGRVRADYPPVRIGIGLNTGIVMLGTIGGTQRMEGTVLSDAVNLASRLEETTKVYQTPLLISEHTLYALNDSSKYCVRFLDRIRVKGKNHPQSVYEVFDTDAPPTRAGKEATRASFEEAVAYYHLKAVDKAIPLFEACLSAVAGDIPAQIYLQRCRDFLKTGHHEGTGEVGGHLEWCDEFLVGYPEIDSQHRELLANINKLATLIASRDVSGIDGTLKFLADYVNFHFDMEERIMRELAYPLMSDHVHEHRELLKQFIRLKGEIVSGLRDPLYLGFQIQLFLFDWFANHTTKTDRHLGRFIRDNAGKRPLLT
ncbi:MAG: guanylate cyclase [Rhodocyclaceae bacterium]|nr:MAG: guanylate cyclase [Rhodocyclaceae bacterium]